MTRYLIYILICCFYTGFSYAQTIKQDTIGAPIFSFSYAIQLPAADLANTFGVNSNLGFTAGYKTENNWQYELLGTFFFSQQVRISTLLDPLVNEDGFIVNAEGKPAPIEVYERGFTGSFNVGRLFNVIGPNPNCGLMAKFGVGVIRHKIRIDNENNLVPLLTEEYRTYFDRLTWGATLYQYIGYQHLSNNNLTNFNIGLEIFEGFTRGMRDYQLDTKMPYNSSRFDVLVGLRLGWIIPVYRKTPNVTG